MIRFRMERYSTDISCMLMMQHWYHRHLPYQHVVTNRYAVREATATAWWADTGTCSYHLEVGRQLLLPTTKLMSSGQEATHVKQY